MVQFRVIWLLGVVAVSPGILAAQDSLDVRRPQATRVELQAAQGQLEQVVASAGYSGALRKVKQAELELVRQRLAEGDFQVGDQIDVAVVGEPSLTGKFPVLADRTLSFPNLPPISLQGVLRSEIRTYLTGQIARYLKNPQVVIQGSYIRVAVLGTISKPGYYSVPADNLVSDVIMAAGGPSGSGDLSKSVVRRNGKEVIPEGALQRAIEEGRSLDQLNLHGGDEIYVKVKAPGSSATPVFQRLFWSVQVAIGMTYFLTQIF